MLSAARIAGRSRVRIPIQERSVRRLPGCGGCFLEGETQNSHPSSADFKNVWRYTSTPHTCLRGVHMDYEGGDTREKDPETETCQVVELTEVSFAIVVITVNK